MKFLKRILSILIFLAIIIIVSAAVYFKCCGMDIIRMVMVNTFKKDVRISNLAYEFPLGACMDYVSVEEEFFAKKIVIQVDPLSLFLRKIKLSAVIFTEPVVKIVKYEGINGYSLGSISKENILMPDVKEMVAVTKNEKANFYVFVEKVIVLRGLAEYSNKDLSFTLKDISLKAEDVSIPLGDSRVRFKMSATLSKPRNFLLDSVVKANGIINIKKKDLDANIEIVQKGNGGVLSAKLVSKDNEMEVNGNVRAERNIIGGTSEQEGKPQALGMILEKVSSSGLGINAEFSFHAKMDDLKVEKVSFKGNFIAKE